MFLNVFDEWQKVTRVQTATVVIECSMQMPTITCQLLADSVL